MSSRTNNYFLLVSFGLGVLLCFLLMRACTPAPSIPKETHHETYFLDIIWPDTVFTPVPVKVPGPRIEVPVLVYDSSACRHNRVYSDSLVDSNIVITYEDSITGILLAKKINYRLKVPLRIETTHRIVDSIPFEVKVPVSGIYGSVEAGFDKLELSNLSIGADFLSNKRWGAGYRYDFLGKTHNISGKYRLLSF